MKALAISIIIPAYNESGYLRACLDAISRQVEPPLEVLLVDNNSTDDTVAIAKEYAFVRVLHEKRQGQVYAQATGFDAAKGDILGRIDADTVIPTNWTVQVRRAFNHERVVAVTGSADPYDVVVGRLSAAVFNFYHGRMGLWATGNVMLWGANTALRSSAWAKIRSEVHYRRDIWEDFDMSFCLAQHGIVRFMPELRVGASFRTGHKTLAQLASYQVRGQRTVALRTNMLQTIVFVIGWNTMYVFVWLPILDRLLMWMRQRIKR